MSQHEPTVDRGVYVLANDVVLRWTAAFVRSFRQSNPDLPLCLIPFDDNTAACEALVTSHGGTVLRAPEAFPRLEKLGRDLETGHTTYGPHWFRRFAAFDGPFRRFLYLDTRIVVLEDLARVIDEVEPGRVDVVHFDSLVNQVYADGPIRREFVRTGRGHGFLSGMWASHRGLYSLAQMEETARELVAVRDQMNPRNTDQFFLNYLCDSRGATSVHFADLHEPYAHFCWAGESRSIYRDRDGAWRRWCFSHPEHRKRLPFVHWAGYRLGPSMPSYHLFDRFQHPHRGPLRRGLVRLRGVPGRILGRLRGNRHVNTLYHRLRARLGRPAR